MTRLHRLSDWSRQRWRKHRKYGTERLQAWSFSKNTSCTLDRPVERLYDRSGDGIDRLHVDQRLGILKAQLRPGMVHQAREAVSYATERQFRQTEH
jgi:hypothetical protein